MSEPVMWPTPCIRNRKSARAMTPSVNNGRRSGGGQSSPPGLEQAIELSMGMVPREMRRLWPTPQAYDSGNPHPPRLKKDRQTRDPDTKGSYRGDLKDVVTWPRPESVETVSQPSLFSAADFPVSPIVSRALAVVPPTRATSGRTSPDLFASFGPDGWCARTSQGFYPQMLDGSLAPFSETWPRAGMTQSGIAYRQVPSAPLTVAIGSGLLPTPNAVETVNPNKIYHSTTNASYPDGRKCQPTLSDVITRQLWPTPCAADAKNVPYQKGDHGTRYPMLLGAVDPARMWPTPNVPNGGRKPKGGMSRTGMTPDGKKRQVGLENAVTMWPTPTAMTGGGGAAMCKWGGSGARAKLRTMTTPQELNGALNPAWVSALMGYPPDWTEVD